MFQYYVLLGIRSLKRNHALTALMVLTLAIGIAASVTSLAILHRMSRDPMPGKSTRLFVPLVDNGQQEGYTPGGRSNRQLSYQDALNFLNSHQGLRRVALYGVAAPVTPPSKSIPMFMARGTAPSGDFFAMFETPFLYGQGWSAQEDAAAADVVVLTRALSERLFGNVNPVGQRLNMMGVQYQVVGVLDNWKLVPRFHRVAGGSNAFLDEDEFFLPFSSAIRHQMELNGNLDCLSKTEAAFEARLASECTWVQFWFETRSAADRAELQSWLDSYAAEQRRLGRLKRQAPNRLFNVSEWLDHLHVVSSDSRLAAWLSGAFLMLCLVNTIGLLLAKFSARASEIGVRRALGASRSEIFQQFLVESAVIGLVGGVMGLLLALAALTLIGMQSAELSTVVQLDWKMLTLTFAMSVLSAVVAGLLPTWRACQITPAIQLKSH